MAFDAQPVLRSDRLLLRPLEADDYKGLHAAASDPETWAGHPAKNRHESEVFRPYFNFLLRAGGTLGIEDVSAEHIIGCSRYYTAPDMPCSISIGFTFLNHRYWGGAWNFELKKLMLGHAFQSFDEVWFHIDPTNIRSQTATRRLGAEHVYDIGLDLSGVEAPWKCYRLQKAAWESVVAARDRQAVS
ncbi:GNAT family N-acetyltransferase [uncultured Roseovarius sp.]|uniref:GNAT family N-acetyltransferase n=1 Tax=uncultured Roseovarius sp. TaxID=293344 RepID=UPI002620F4FE|nr:GNAT family N-acetyltransferase [uncultured Roseovarius sp.]